MLKSNRLQSDLVILQKYSLNDTYELFEAISDSIDRVYPWLPWCHRDYTIAETEAWLRSRPPRWDEGKEFGFTIRDRQNKIVGGCGINIGALSWCGNLGYWLRTGFTGKGYATIAILNDMRELLLPVLASLRSMRFPHRVLAALASCLLPLPKI